jgi:SP family xylose:H+ symportor-like MFS transporter
MEGQKKYFVYVITLVATLGGLLFGYDTAVISGTVGALEQFFISPLQMEETATNSTLGFLISSALIGCIVGGFLGGPISSRMGRKNGLIFAASLFLVSALGSSMPELFFAPIGSGDHTFMNHFVFYRVLGGIGVGLASMLSPMYIAEIAPPSIRGKLVSWNQFAIVTGILIVYFVNYFIANQGDDTWLHSIGWRWMFASEIVPASLFLFFLLFVPESPRFLAMKNKKSEAFSILQKINGTEQAKLIIEEINNSLHAPKGNGKLFSFGFTVIIIGLSLSILQQFLGINVVLYYAPEIFKSMGAKNNAAFLQTVIVGAINFIFTIVAIYSVDKYGRKPLQIIGALGMGIFMFGLGFSLFFEQKGIGTLIFMLGFVACFALSWGPVVWVLLSEIFPNRIRAKALAIAVAVQWIANFVVSATFPIMKNSTWLNEQFNGGFAFWVYGTIGFIAALFMWKVVPETKGKTLEELEILWENK